MTVVVWDKRTLAADSFMTDDGGIVSVQKIFRLPNGSLYGGAGDAGYCALVRDWLVAGGEQKGRPDCSRYERSSFSGILILRDGSCSALDSHLSSIPITGKFYAIGSGAAHAMALMSTGMSSAQAVRHIIEHGLADGVGGEVQTLTLSRGRKSKP